jgi:hypothetical protein
VDAVPVVWIAPAGVERPKLADHALEEWGRARGFHLSAPEPGHGPELAVDTSIADGVEAELEKARDATSALDANGAERSLARAETLLRDHPELPQGAWLMAEVERGWAMRWARVTPKQPERASAAWRHARSLDGGREPGLGEEAVSTVDPDVGFVLALDGSGDVRLDGLPAAAGTLHATAGDHQVTVTRSGRLVWADWIAVTDGATVRVALPETPRCSAEELSKVRHEGGALHADGIACDRWVVAEPWTPEGTILVATCVMDRCGALLEWRVGGAGPVIPEDGGHRSRWPAWATWTLIGVGAAAIAGVTIGIDEAFHTSQPEGGFDVGGIKRTTRR